MWSLRNISPSAERRAETLHSPPSKTPHLGLGVAVHLYPFSTPLKLDHSTMECPVCDREFRGEGSLKQHCRDSHPRTYCLRCERPFANRASLQQHISSSSNHYRCEHCPHKPDFGSYAALEEHEKNLHKLCKPCDRSFETPESLQQHDIDVHNLCKDCGDFFDTENSLHNVRNPIKRCGIPYINIQVASEDACRETHSMSRMLQKLRQGVSDDVTP